MPREGIKKFEDIFHCEIMDQFNLTETKVPVVFVKKGYISFNMRAIRLLNETPFVQIYINRDEEYMLAVPCHRFAPHAVDWCKINKKTGKTEPKELRSKGLSPKLYRLMHWDTELSYKVQCYYQDFGNGKCLLYFDLRVPSPMTTTLVTTSKGTTRRRTVPVQQAAEEESFGPIYKDLLQRLDQDFSGYYVTDSDSEEGEGQLVMFGKASNNELPLVSAADIAADTSDATATQEAPELSEMNATPDFTAISDATAAPDEVSSDVPAPEATVPTETVMEPDNTVVGDQDSTWRANDGDESQQPG